MLGLNAILFAPIEILLGSTISDRMLAWIAVLAICIAINTLLVWLDCREIDSSSFQGRRPPAIVGILLVPAYLVWRAVAIKDFPGYALTWIVLFCLGLTIVAGPQFSPMAQRADSVNDLRLANFESYAETPGGEYLPFDDFGMFLAERAEAGMAHAAGVTADAFYVDVLKSLPDEQGHKPGAYAIGGELLQSMGANKKGTYFYALGHVTPDGRVHIHKFNTGPTALAGFSKDDYARAIEDAHIARTF